MDWGIIGLGCIGGSLPDIIRLIQNRYKSELPQHYKSLSFWVGLILLICLGGFAAWLGGAKEAKEALAYGFGAPEIVSRLLSSPGIVKRNGQFNMIRRWWSF